MAVPAQFALNVSLGNDFHIVDFVIHVPGKINADKKFLQHLYNGKNSRNSLKAQQWEKGLINLTVST